MRSENTPRVFLKRLLCALLCLALTCGAVAFMSSCNQGSEAEKPTEAATDADNEGEEDGESEDNNPYNLELNENGLVDVLIFTKDAPRGTKITSKMLDTVEMPVENLPKNVVSKITEVRGKYTSRDFYAGDYIIKNRISDKAPLEINVGVIQQEIVTTKNDFIVVTDFIKADTGEDLYDSLQMLINKNTGRTIYFPDGEYVISHPLETKAVPETSTSFYFSSGAVLKASENFSGTNGLNALICLGSLDKKNDIRTPGSNFYVMGGIFDCGGQADGISIDGGRETLIKDVVIVNCHYGIHIKEGTNNNSSDSDLDDITIIGNGRLNSTGIVTQGLDNTITNIRISNVGRGLQISAGVFVANCTVENTAGIKNMVAFGAGGNDSWYSNCVSINCDIAFQTGGARGFFKQCSAIWTGEDFTTQQIMFDTTGSALRSALMTCKADFADIDVPTAFLKAGANGSGRVVAPVYDVALVTDIDATQSYLESGISVITPAPTTKKDD